MADCITMSFLTILKVIKLSRSYLSRALLCEDRTISKTTLPSDVEENVWLGVNVIVLKGVRIGKNTVIGANSVVTKNIPANVIAAGNPCKILSNLK